MEEKVKVLIEEEQVKEKIADLGREISEDYAGRELVLLPVLRGSVYFTVDLSRQLEIPFTLDFIGISSYGGAADPRGIVRITKDLDVNIAGQQVLLVEDIVDTGLTLGYLLNNLRTRNPASLRVCTLLNMPARRIIDVAVDYQGFDVPDTLIVGYGLDYQERYRNLPFIGTLT